MSGSGSGALIQRILAATGLAAVLALALLGRFALVERERAENEGRALRDVALAARVSTAFSTLNGMGCAHPELLADPAFVQSVPVDPTLPPTFVDPLRAGYRFTFSGRRANPRDESGFILKPAYASCTYVATPLEIGTTGRRSFAFFSDRPGYVYQRDDGTPPTAADAPVPLLQALRGTP